MWQVLLARTLQTRDRENPGRLVSAGRRPNGGELRAGKVGPRLRLRRTGAISDSHRDDESVAVSFFLRSPAHKHPSLSLPQTPRFRFSRRQDGRREAAQGDARPTERSPAGHLPLSAIITGTHPIFRDSSLFSTPSVHTSNIRERTSTSLLSSTVDGDGDGDGDAGATARMHGRLRAGAESAHPPPSSHLCLHIRAIARLVARL